MATSGGAVTAGGSSSGGSAAGGRASGGGSSSGGSVASGGGSSSGGSGAGGGTGTSGGTTGSGGSTGGKTVPPSGLPEVGTGNVPQPSGAAGGLKILDWAGFKGAVSYTLDDALMSQVNTYSMINATGGKVTFYLVQGNDKNNTIWKTAAMDGHELGNHTAHHCQGDGSGCAWGTYAGSLQKEIEDNTAHIKSAFGVEGVYTMAAPFGASQYVQAAPTAHMFINRGVSGETAIAPNDNTNRFSLPCYDMPNGAGADVFNGVIGKARTNNRWYCFLIHSINTSEGYRQVPIQSIVSSITAAKTAGDIWVDTVATVGAYWQGQKAVSAAITGGGSSTWTWTLPADFPPKKYLRVTVTGGKLSQNGANVPWNAHGYYEIALDEKSLTLTP